MKTIKVIHVSDDYCSVSLNAGTREGISLGDKFLVYAVSDHEIIDPDTNESLGFLEFVKGTGKVIHVQEKLCTIESNTFKKPTPKKTIRTEKHNNSILSIYGPATTEETILSGEPEQIPFDCPQIGDLAKQI